LETKLKKFIPKKNQWMLILLVGILLVVIAIPTNKSSILYSDSSYEKTQVQADNLEKRLKNLLEQIEGVGEVHIMITYAEDTKVDGIVILADGGGNAVVARKISDVVQALFTVDSHKIKVIERNQNK